MVSTDPERHALKIQFLGATFFFFFGILTSNVEGAVYTSKYSVSPAVKEHQSRSIYDYKIHCSLHIPPIVT